MRKLFLLSFFLLFHFLLVAMEQEVKQIVVEDFDGAVFSIPEDEFCIFGLIKKWNDELGSENEEDKFYLEGVPSFTQENLRRLLIIVESKKVDLCDENITKIIFQLADVLQAPKKILKKISKKAWKDLSLEEINEDIPGIYTYLKSVNSIPREHINFAKNLYLINRKICYLQGIQALANTTTQSIDLNNNRLRVVNIKKLLKLFPNLKQLDLGHNQLEKIKLPYHLPDFFILNLSNNMLVTIPAFKVREGCIVNFYNNPLSDNSRTIALNAAKRNYGGFLKSWCRWVLYSADLNDYCNKLKWSEPIGGGIGGAIAWVKSWSTQGKLLESYDVLVSSQPPPIVKIPEPNMFGIIDFFKITIINPDAVWHWKHVEKFEEIPSDVTNLKITAIITGGLLAGITGAWFLTNYSPTYDAKKYKKSQIIV